MTGAEVRTIREALGLTQGELGQWLLLSGGQPDHTVRMWETGLRSVGGPVAVALTAFAAGYRPPHVIAAAKPSRR